MPTVEFAPALTRHVPAPMVLTVTGASLRVALDAALAQTPALAGYVVDDQHAVRKHVAVFVNGVLVHDRRHLAVPLDADDRIYVAQALSGG